MKTRLFAFWLLASVTNPAHAKPPAEFIFPGVSGPSEESVVPKRVVATAAQYERGSNSRLALFLASDAGPWLGLVHGLRAIGIPFNVTTDYKTAVKHRVVLIYPADSTRYLSNDAMDAFNEFVEKGGTAIGIEAQGPGSGKLFGFADTKNGRDHVGLHFAAGPHFPWTDPKERDLHLGEPGGKHALVTYSYQTPSADTLAVYDDGSAAILYRKAGSGQAIAIGLDLSFLLLMGYDDRNEFVARTYVNDYEPILDVFLRFVKKLYTDGEPGAVTMHTVPMQKNMTVLLTHDIDYSRSMSNAVTYAKMEVVEDVPATYFVQTKYVRDWSDSAWFDSKALPQLKQIVDLGMEIGSHSVAHSRQYAKFVLGDGKEKYPDYAPHTKDETATEGGTVLGELRISKFLLEHFTGKQVVSFRPGHLANPYTLPQSLVATGFEFSSSTPANESLTHLPFQLTYGREFDSPVDRFEFPITLEDERIPAPQRLKPALAIAANLKNYGGLFNILIHPSTLEDIDFERKFIQATKHYSHYSTVGDFGRWWRARNRMQVDVTVGKAGEITVHLDAPESIAGFGLDVPDDWRLTTTSGGPAGMRVGQRGSSVLVTTLKGSADLHFTSLQLSSAH